MVNYQLGKIYKLISPSGLIYIGSTCETLSNRLSGHKSSYKRYNENKTKKKITSFKLLEEDINNIDIVLIEKYPCNSKEELHSRERYYIDLIDCVNTIKPLRTTKEYHNDNKEAILIKHKIWIENNKEHVAEYNKEYCKKWSEENKEYKSEMDKKWREENKEHKAKKDKEYYEKNKELILAKIREKRNKNKINIIP